MVISSQSSNDDLNEILSMAISRIQKRFSQSDTEEFLILLFRDVITTLNKKIKQWDKEIEA